MEGHSHYDSHLDLDILFVGMVLFLFYRDFCVNFKVWGCDCKKKN